MKTGGGQSKVSMHRKINNILTVIVIGLGSYLLFAPFMPSIDFWVKKRGGFDAPSYAIKTEDKKVVADIPSDNRLAIPSIGLDEHVFESTAPNGINKGVYQRPKTSDPSLGGNTVFVGHRFSYFPNIPAPFYNLDKVKVDDEIVVVWKGVIYRYKVKEIKVVEPTDITVESPSKDSKLTIYTCTPLWSASQRLVIISEQITERAAQ